MRRAAATAKHRGAHEVVIGDSRHTVSCKGKRCYSWSDASRVAKTLRNRTDHRAGQYKCRMCGWWHIGGSRP